MGVLLRRITESIRNQDWTLVFTELLIVVVGVFLGLQASNWNDQRIERNLERGYLVRLHEDFVASALGIEIDNTFSKEQLAAQQMLLAALDTCHVAEEDEEVVQWGINSLGFLNAPRFFRRTFNELASSGRIDIFQNSDLSEELANIVAEVEFREKVQESIFRSVEHHRFIVDEHVRYDLTRPIEGSDFAVAVDYNIEELCKLPKLVNSVSAISLHTRDRLIAFQQLEHRYRRFLPMIENELQSRWNYNVNRD